MIESGSMIYLASNSPRRRQLLTLGGWIFRVVSAQVDESVLSDEIPEAYVLRLAEHKACAAQAHLIAGTLHPEDLIVAADTSVVVTADQGKPTILGKPTDAAEAAKMLRKLGGRQHQVYTGIAVLRPGDGTLLSDTIATTVKMRSYSEDEIHEYIATGDPLDKAGAYAIQHAGFHPVESIEGCFANVMGLPLCHLARLLEALGAPAHTNIVDACQKSLDTPCRVFQEVTSG